MNAIPLFLADAENGDVLASWRISDPIVLEYLAIFAAIGLVTLLLLIWAAFIRKKRRRKHSHHHHHHHHHSSQPAEAPEVRQAEAAPAPAEKRRRRRHSRHRHRPRNPTLAETGGLPPVRPEGPPTVEP
jgi:type VI protein secretion system component VasK